MLFPDICEQVFFQEPPSAWRMTTHKPFVQRFCLCLAGVFILSFIEFPSADDEIVAISAGSAAVMVLLGNVLLLSCVQWASWKLEVILATAVAVAVTLEGFTHYRSFPSGRDNIMLARTLPLILQLPKVSAFTFLSWTLWVDMLLIFHFGSSEKEWSGLWSQHARQIMCSFLTSAFFFLAHISQQRRQRELYESERETKAEIHCLKALFSNICDATFRLAEDGRTVVQCDAASDVARSKFCQIGDLFHILTSRAEQNTYKRVLKSSTSQVVSSMSATLQSCPTGAFSDGGSILKARLLIADRYATCDRQRTDTSWRYMLIVLPGDTFAVMAAADAVVADDDDVISRKGNQGQKLSKVQQKAVEIYRGGAVTLPTKTSINKEAPEKSAASLSIEESLASLRPETSETGKIFTDFELECLANTLQGEGDCESSMRELFAHLSRMADVGDREGWLLAAKDVEVHPHKILGAGGFGIVLGGRLHGTEVAVKLPKSAADGTHASKLTSLSNELRILRRVRHPNIVLFFGAIVEPVHNSICLVLESVKGTNLRLFVASLSKKDVVVRYKLISDIVCALRYLHAQDPRIVHGDLKDSNILVEASMPSAKLLDFGLSRMLTANHVRPLGGTLIWKAPELIQRRGTKPSAKSDVFSFGRVVYLVWTGLVPLNGYDRGQIIQDAKDGKVHDLVWPSDTALASQISMLCNMVLDMDPRLRPTMAEVQTKLSTWPIGEWSRKLTSKQAHTRGFLAQANACDEALNDVTGSAANLQDSLQQARRNFGRIQDGLLGSQAPPKGESNVVELRDAVAKERETAVESIQVGEPLSSVPEDAEDLDGGSYEGRNGTQDVLQFALSNLDITSRQSKVTMLSDAMSRWNFHLGGPSCCRWHSGCLELLAVTNSMLNLGCNQGYAPYDEWQCPSCGVLEYEYRDYCDVCGHEEQSCQNKAFSVVLSPAEPNAGQQDSRSRSRSTFNAVEL